MSFRLGNEDFEMLIWEIKKALKMPLVCPQFPTYNKNDFWGRITSSEEGYSPKLVKSPKIISHGLRYMHRFLAHTICGR